MRTFKATLVAALGLGVLSGTFTSAAAAGDAPDAPRRIASLDSDYSEVTTTTNPNAKGRARLTLFSADDKICYRVEVTGMTTRAVYVFRRSTDVLMTRLYDEAPTDDNVLKGCVTDVPAKLMTAYEQHPKRFYIQASSYDGQDEIGGTMRLPR